MIAPASHRAGSGGVVTRPSGSRRATTVRPIVRVRRELRARRRRRGVRRSRTWTPPRVSLLLANLVDKSMVQLVDEDLPRYRLLETLREYGRDHLGDAERATVRARHAAWYLEVAEQCARSLAGPDEATGGQDARPRLRQSPRRPSVVDRACRHRHRVAPGRRAPGVFVPVHACRDHRLGRRRHRPARRPVRTNGFRSRSASPPTAGSCEGTWKAPSNSENGPLPLPIDSASTAPAWPSGPSAMPGSTRGRHERGVEWMDRMMASARDGFVGSPGPRLLYAVGRLHQCR